VIEDIQNQKVEVEKEIEIIVVINVKIMSIMERPVFA